MGCLLRLILKPRLGLGVRGGICGTDIYWRKLLINGGIWSIVNFTSMDKILAETLNLVFSSNRPMPAHYTSNGDRDQSFCIDFEPLTASDEYDMASESFNTASNYITEKSKLSQDQFAAVIKCGEDIMVGAYIITKLDGKELIEEMQKVILDDAIKAYSSEVDNLKKILSLDEVKKYFDHCADFGKTKAE